MKDDILSLTREELVDRLEELVKKRIQGRQNNADLADRILDLTQLIQLRERGM